jgi:hypothetical protein
VAEFITRKIKKKTTISKKEKKTSQMTSIMYNLPYFSLLVPQTNKKSPKEKKDKKTKAINNKLK